MRAALHQPETRARHLAGIEAAKTDPMYHIHHKIGVLLNWEKRHLKAGRVDKAAEARRKAEQLMAGK